MFGLMIGILTMSCNAENRIKSSALPEIGYSAICPEDRGGEIIARCRMKYSDNLIYGDIVGIEANYSPSVILDEEKERYVVSCNGSVVPGIVVVIEGARTAIEKPEEKWRILIGPDMMEKYKPMPVIDSDGKVRWVGQESASSGKLEIGKKIGAMVNELAIDGNTYYAIKDNPLFVLEDNSKVGFQIVTGACVRNSMLDYSGMSIDDLYREFVRSRDSVECGEINDGLSPSLWLPVCNKQENRECSTDGDCSAGWTCVSGKCERN